MSQTRQQFRAEAAEFNQQLLLMGSHVSHMNTALAVDRLLRAPDHCLVAEFKALRKQLSCPHSSESVFTSYPAQMFLEMGYGGRGLDSLARQYRGAA